MDFIVKLVSCWLIIKFNARVLSDDRYTNQSVAISETKFSLALYFSNDNTLLQLRRILNYIKCIFKLYTIARYNVQNEYPFSSVLSFSISN